MVLAAKLVMQGLLDTAAANEGKMFGVLLAKNSQGQFGYLKAFFGTWRGFWTAPGFVPPAFDLLARDALEPQGVAIAAALLARSEQLRATQEYQGAQAAWTAVKLQTQAALSMLLRQLQDRKRSRALHRHSIKCRASAGPFDEGATSLADLDQQSRGDKAQRRIAKATHNQLIVAAEQAWKPWQRKEAALERLQRLVSRHLCRGITDTYVLENGAGQRAGMRDLFAPAAPPPGTGDCASPKLLAYAFANRMVPLGLAEFWWGPPPTGGGRVQGQFYPACKNRCRPLLHFMLQGVAVADVEAHVTSSFSAELEIIYEDDALLAVHKPAGMLSVPGRGPQRQDCLATRLARLRPSAIGPLLVHRLDEATSGVLLAAKTHTAYVALQKQFRDRQVQKRYLAWLQGNVAGSEGTIQLPIRLDVDDRPRQIYDPIRGKAATTRWKVIEQRGDQTRVHLWPLTGRTHQLRVHAAHPLGLFAPIVGDRLYGTPGERLMLHAEELCFSHPTRNERITITVPSPF